MALILTRVQNPAQLLADFKRLIDNGSVRTWRYTNNDFFFEAAQYKRDAYFTAVIDTANNQLKFGLHALPHNNRRISRATYGIFHGHLTIECLTHLYRQFAYASNSAEKVEPDDFDWLV